MSKRTRHPDPDSGSPEERRPAGEFAAWLRDTRRAQGEALAVNVPCGECIGCCTSSYFIHVGPDEARTLARIPADLRFPAPGLPSGHVLLGYDERGRCPMLVAGRCSIYIDRPRTCRSYDCRVFTAACLLPGADDKPVIHARVRSWEFRYAGEAARAAHRAVRAAAGFLREHAALFPAGFVPGNDTQLAMLAVKVGDVFLDAPGTQEAGATAAARKAIARAVVARLRPLEGRGARAPRPAQPSRRSSRKASP